LYQNGNSLIAHRVIRILQQDKKRIFVTKGDNHAYIDAALIPEEAFRGRIQAAFFENEPQKNILINNRMVARLYIVMGNLVLFFRRNRESIPKVLRVIFKPLVGGFFLVFKKAIHFIYLLFMP
jgi:hypothetical protein